MRLNTSSQADSCLEAEKGFELRQSCSRAYTQPPHKQEKSGHVCSILLFLLSLITNRTEAFVLLMRSSRISGLRGRDLESVCLDWNIISIPWLCKLGKFT